MRLYLLFSVVKLKISISLPSKVIQKILILFSERKSYTAFNSRVRKSIKFVRMAKLIGIQHSLNQQKSCDSCLKKVWTKVIEVEELESDIRFCRFFRPHFLTKKGFLILPMFFFGMEKDEPKVNTLFSYNHMYLFGFS